MEKQKKQYRQMNNIFIYKNKLRKILKNRKHLSIQFIPKKILCFKREFFNSLW